MNELLTTIEMAEADRLAAAGGIESLDLMEAAGREVARSAALLAVVGKPIVVICGPGNNGGDGFVAARHLRREGWDVRLLLTTPRGALKGDAAEMARRYEGVAADASIDVLQGAGLIVDAMYGAGLSRAIEGDAARLVEAVNASGLPVLAVDVPSGLDGTTGAPTGPCIAARRTVTFFRKKPAHVLLPGRTLCGEVALADIGIPGRVLTDIGPAAFENGPDLWMARYPWPRSDGHKYQRGHAIVVSGPAEQAGAARLSARAALRAGAGLVTLIGNAAATAINAAHTNAIMVRAVAGGVALSDFLGDERRNAVLMGPGASVGQATADNVLRILRTRAVVVLDADALTSFAGPASQGSDVSSSAAMGFLRRDAEAGAMPATLFAAIAGREAAVAMTPHEGEFKRLFGEPAGSKLDRARQAARLSCAVVVLKGADTVIAAPDGRAIVNTNAPPWLATAGSGDVLAGLITGLAAQRMPMLEAAAAAVWLHGAAASHFGIGLIAEDLPEALPAVLRKLHATKAAMPFAAR